MKRHHLFDSIALWFALNVAAAILIALLMSMAFVQFAGVWARPSIGSAGLIEQIAGITRAVDEIPATERTELARKLTSSAFTTSWYPTRNLVPIAAKQDKKEHDPYWAKLTQLLGRPDAAILGADADDFTANAAPAPALRKYALAVELSDHSWIMFDTAQRTWGIDRGLRMLLTTLFVLLSSGIIASAASRRLARPVQRFADAAESFGAGSRAEPLPLVGPWEIREAASAFNAMQERIQQLMDSRTEMITAISHDLRAPLTRMRLRGEFLEDIEQQRKLFRDVDEMQAMIDASMAFFRLDGQQEEMTRFEWRELIHTVVGDFREMDLPVETAELMPLVYVGRPLALKRVLTNLIDNAVKYGSRARIALSLQNSQVTITIDDDGPGVPPSLLPKLFLPFFRVEASRNRATGGFGLGLPSARSIIRNHGGDLTLENRIPHGLRAIVTLPHAADKV